MLTCWSSTITPRTRDLLVTILKTEGYDVSVAEDGAVGVDRYRQRRADIVLMDLYMPRKDGVTAIRELRGEFPDVVIVAMSGDAGTVLARCASRGTLGPRPAHVAQADRALVLLRALEGLVAARRSLQAASLHRSAVARLRPRVPGWPARVLPRPFADADSARPPRSHQRPEGRCPPAGR